MKLNKRFKRSPKYIKKFSSGELKRRHGFVQSQLLNLGHTVFPSLPERLEKLRLGFACKVHSCSVFEWELTHINRLRYIRFFLIVSIYVKKYNPF